MKKEIKEKFPSWCNNLDTNYTLCLSNDLDSLLSCIFLKQIKGYEISHFYTFKALGISENHEHVRGKLIGVDIDLTKGKTWGNHVTMLSKKDKYNKSCANINVIDKISRENYFDKYCGSTLLQILSYYNYDISNLSEEAKMILLCIDGTYIPFFPWKIDFSGTIKRYLKLLEYEELIKVAERHTKAEFQELVSKYNLNATINVKKGYLTTDADLAGLSKVFSMPIELPEQGFKLLTEFEIGAKSIGKDNYSIVKSDDIFSVAVTNKNFYAYSKIKKGVE